MSRNKHESLPYRAGVGMILLNRRGHVFVGQRIDTTMEAWQMPQGGIDDGEDPETAALRELEEEVGTKNVEIITRTEDWLCYDLPADIRARIWGGNYRGQRQIWFVMRFLGRDSEINITTAHPEFSHWKWAPWDELGQMIVPFKRQLYLDLKARFEGLAGNA